MFIKEKLVVVDMVRGISSVVVTNTNNTGAPANDSGAATATKAPRPQSGDAQRAVDQPSAPNTSIGTPARSDGTRPTSGTSPAALRTREARLKDPIIIIVAKPDEHGIQQLPSEAKKALDAFKNANSGDVRDDSSADVIAYNVKSSLAAQFKAIVEKYPQLSTMSVEDVVRPKGSTPAYSDATLTTLKGPPSPAQTLALRSVYAALSGDAKASIPNDTAVRNAMADAVSDAAEFTYEAIFTLTERAAMFAVLKEQPEAKDTVGEVLKAGGTPNLNAARDVLRMCAEVLEKLGTSRSRARLLKLTEYNDGAREAAVSAMAQHPETVKTWTDITVGMAKTRFDQTAATFATNAFGLDGQVDTSHLCGGQHMGSYSKLGGRIRAENDYLETEDRVFDHRDVPTVPLLFLGTENSGIVRQAITDFLLDADAGLPNFLERHKALFTKIERERNPDITEEDVRKRYEKYALTGQADVERVVNMLGWGRQIRDSDVNSNTHAFCEIAGIFDDVLAKVKTPQMHRLLANGALMVLDESYKRLETPTPEVEAAAAKLRQRLVTPGPDAEVHTLAAAALAQTGAAGGVS